MVIKVQKYIESGVNLSKFFNITEKFNKKFYKIRYRSHQKDKGGEYHYLKIEAIGVSRDLIYRIYWDVDCNIRDDLNLPHKCYPQDEGNRNWLYPLWTEEVNDDAWQWNCFERNSFVEVDFIEEIKN